jgi:hypothetical protein
MTIESSSIMDLLRFILNGGFMLLLLISSADIVLFVVMFLVVVSVLVCKLLPEGLHLSRGYTTLCGGRRRIL